MSHITKFESKIKDINLLHESLESLKREGKLDYTWLGEGTQQSYSTTTTGTHFKLANWNYPVCIHEDGSMSFDNYHGNWGKPIDLDRVVQRYNEKLLVKNARENGWQVERAVNDAGDVTLRLIQ